LAPVPSLPKKRNKKRKSKALFKERKRVELSGKLKN